MGALTLAGGGAFYFAKKEIDADRRQKHLDIQRRQRASRLSAKPARGELTAVQASSVSSSTATTGSSATRRSRQARTRHPPGTSPTRMRRECAKSRNTRPPRCTAARGATASHESSVRRVYIRHGDKRTGILVSNCVFITILSNPSLPCACTVRDRARNKRTAR